MKNGQVMSLWRYPVKSLKGEKLKLLEFDLRGVKGDRVFAVTNLEGKFGSGKNTRRFRRIDGLLDLSSRMIEGDTYIKFQDNQELKSDDANINNKLSEKLGQRVTLNKENEIAHFDDGSVHILTTASIKLLKKHLDSPNVDLRRFRSNIVLDTHLLDEQLLGKIIKIGGVVLEITHKTERCAMVAMSQDGLQNRAEILKKIAKNFDLNFGVYAKVKTIGSISLGDTFEVID